MSAGWTRKTTAHAAADKRRLAETKKTYKQKDSKQARNSGNNNNKTVKERMNNDN